MIEYGKEQFDIVNKNFNKNIKKVLKIYKDILSSKISWKSFIDYQNILIDTLYKLKVEEFKLKKILKEIHKNKDKLNNETEIKKYLESLKNGEYQIKIFGEFLAWIFYKNDIDLIDNHMEQQAVNINSIGSGTQAEITAIKKLNTEDNQQFYIYNNITTFLRLGDVSVFDKNYARIIGYGEIKSSMPDENSIVTINIDVITSFNLNKEDLNDIPKKKINYDFLTEDMKKHLEKQLKVMGDNLKIKNDKKHIEANVESYHYKDFEKLINKCYRNGYAFIKISDNVAYLSVKSNLIEMNPAEMLDTRTIESLLTPQLSKEKSFMQISPLDVLTYGKSMPFLLLPISTSVKRKYLKQTIFIFYTFNKVIADLEKKGYTYKKTKGRATLFKIENNKKILIDLLTCSQLITKMFLDEKAIMNTTKKMLDKTKKLPNNSNVYMTFVNHVNKPSKKNKRNSTKITDHI